MMTLSCPILHKAMLTQTGTKPSGQPDPFALYHARS